MSQKREMTLNSSVSQVGQPNENTFNLGPIIGIELSCDKHYDNYQGRCIRC